MPKRPCSHGLDSWQLTSPDSFVLMNKFNNLKIPPPGLMLACCRAQILSGLISYISGFRQCFTQTFSLFQQFSSIYFMYASPVGSLLRPHISDCIPLLNAGDGYSKTLNNGIVRYDSSSLYQDQIVLPYEALAKTAFKIASRSLWPRFASANQLSVWNPSPQLLIHDHLPSPVLLFWKVACKTRVHDVHNLNRPIR